MKKLYIVAIMFSSMAFGQVEVTLEPAEELIVSRQLTKLKTMEAALRELVAQIDEKQKQFQEMQGAVNAVIVGVATEKGFEGCSVAIKAEDDSLYLNCVSEKKEE
jgi:PleD family two-component response regulator